MQNQKIEKLLSRVATYSFVNEYEVEHEYVFGIFSQLRPWNSFSYGPLAQKEYKG